MAAKIVSRGDPIEPIYLNNLRVAARGWGVVSGLAVSQRGAGANMSVDIATGEAWINGTKVTKGSTTNETITAAHASYARYDLVVINSSGAISVIDGTAAATSYANDYDLQANNAILLSEVYVPATDTTIEDAQITDKQIISFIELINAANGIAGLDGSGELLESVYAGILEKYIISDNVLHSHDFLHQTASLSYVKQKTITLDTLFPTPSTLRVHFDLATVDAAHTAYGRIYKNGGAVGTERTTNTIYRVGFDEDISFVDGDTVEVWIHTANASTFATTKEFDIKGDETDYLLAEAIVNGDVGLADPFAATNS